MSVNKRINGNIELCRYFLTLLVAAMHYWANVYGDASYLEGGYLAVDAFFMISGYFLAASYSKRSDNPYKFTFNKWKSMFLTYESSILLSILIISWSDLLQVPRRIVASIPDMLGLQMTGFYLPVTNGVLWYISSMLIAGLIISAFYRKDKENFVNCIAPIFVLVFYSLIYFYNGNLDAIGKDVSFIVPFGNLRAIAGMSAGVLLYNIYIYMKKIKVNKALMSFLELAAIGLFLMCVAGFGHTKWDFLSLIAVPIILIAASTKQTFWGELSDNLGNWLAKVMGKSFTLTAYVFSTSVYMVLVKVTSIEQMNKYASLGIYLVVLIIFSYLFTSLINHSERFFKMLKERKSNDTEI